MTSDVVGALGRFKQGLEKRDRSVVNGAAHELIELRAPLGAQWQAVANALQHNGEWNLAIAAIEQMVAQRSGDAVSRYARANVLYQGGRLREALAELDALEAEGQGPTTASHKVSILNSHASCNLQLGRTKLAHAELIEALRIDPRSGQSWLSFTEVANFRKQDGHMVPLLERTYSEGPSEASEGMKLAHAMGRMRHDRGDHSGAFEAFAHGAELFCAQGAAPVTKAKFDLTRQCTSFTPKLIKRVAERIHVNHDRVIFVSGLPRSGTTLVEQILASHSTVEHGEEVGLMRHVAQEVGGLEAANLETWLDAGGDPNSLVELYLHLAEERFGPTGKFIDKTVEAGNYMGLLLALFPKAPIFWLHRDPIDNGWSAFRATFARGAAWSWRLEDVGSRLAQEEQMIDYWYKMAGDRIAFVDYEKLVTEPSAQIPRIAAAAGLTLEEQMLRPHETKRTVATASVSQVREPINLKGIGVAEPYRRWLGPMIKAYERDAAHLRTAEGR